MSIRLTNDVYQLRAELESLQKVLARVEERLAALEAAATDPEPSRGPGRPRKDRR